ncbi:MAG TPA: hypothetical protein VEQ41_02110 [Solirubrobacterales bacterium]|nr:hypothetical protein [Solirubrobacterales bacterium]
MIVSFEHPDLGNVWTNASETLDGIDNDGNEALVSPPVAPALDVVARVSPRLGAPMTRISRPSGPAS